MIAALLALVALAGPAIGEPLPWFAGWSAADEVVNRDAVIADGGRVLVLFATWCAPCEAGLRALASPEGKAALGGVPPVLIAVGEAPAVVEPWLAARGLAGARVIYDRFGTAARDLGVERIRGEARSLALPRAIVLGEAGRVRAVLDGAAAHDLGRIGAALGAKAISPSPAGP